MEEVRFLSEGPVWVVHEVLLLTKHMADDRQMTGSSWYGLESGAEVRRWDRLLMPSMPSSLKDPLPLGWSLNYVVDQ